MIGCLQGLEKEKKSLEKAAKDARESSINKKIKALADGMKKVKKLR